MREISFDRIAQTVRDLCIQANCQLPEDVRLSACKLSEDNSGVIVRVFSTAEAAQTVRLPLPDAVTAVSACNLAETERTPLPCEDGVLEFPIRPGQIRTFFWELRSNH